MKTFQEHIISKEKEIDEGFLNSLKSMWRLTKGRYTDADYDRALQAAQAVVSSPEALHFGTTAWNAIFQLGLLAALGAGNKQNIQPQEPMISAKTDDIDELNPIKMAKPSDLERFQKAQEFAKIKRK